MVTTWGNGIANIVPGMIILVDISMSAKHATPIDANYYASVTGASSIAGVQGVSACYIIDFIDTTSTCTFSSADIKWDISKLMVAGAAVKARGLVHFSSGSPTTIGLTTLYTETGAAVRIDTSSTTLAP
jgi:hypothetical protein